MNDDQFDESVQLEIESILAIFPREVSIISNSRILVECANNIHLNIRLPQNYPRYEILSAFNL
jgi:hypothetical protein